MTTNTMLGHSCQDAADLLTFLTRLKDGGFDLSAIKVCNGHGEEFATVDLTSTMLTDKSIVHDIRFFLDPKFE